jgi:hypothetical protein
VTVTAPVVLNAVNLYRLSVERLGLTGPAALALPVTLDAAALVALIVRLRALRDGDSAPGASLAVLAFAGISAWLAAIEGHTVGGTVGAVALGVLPIVAVVMLDLAVASIRRADHRAAGLLPGRAPVYSGLRWVLAPISTAKAWRHGVLWENADRLACLAATVAPERIHGTPIADRIDPHPVDPHPIDRHRLALDRIAGGPRRSAAREDHDPAVVTSAEVLRRADGTDGRPPLAPAPTRRALNGPHAASGRPSGPARQSPSPVSVRPGDLDRARQAIADGRLPIAPTAAAIRGLLAISPAYARATRDALRTEHAAGSGSPAPGEPESGTGPADAGGPQANGHPRPDHHQGHDRENHHDEGADHALPENDRRPFHESGSSTRRQPTTETHMTNGRTHTDATALP